MLLQVQHLLKGEQVMKNDDTFSDIEAQSSSRPDADTNSDVLALSSSHNGQQDSSSSDILPQLEQRHYVSSLYAAFTW